MDSLLSGAAFITGAGSGIGRATATAFADCGVQKLALVDLNEEGLKAVEQDLKSRTVDVAIIVADISNEGALVNAISTTVQKFGRIDYAVNNAGVAGPMGPTLETPLDSFKVPFDVNVAGTWMGMREQIKIMRNQDVLPSSKGRRNRGVIVNVASILGIVGTSELMPAVPYSASKHAILGLTKSEASIYVKENIRINATCPGLISTPIICHEGVEVKPAQLEMQKCPMGRFGKSEEIADSIVFLCSEMSSFMSGAALVVDGGHLSQL